MTHPRCKPVRVAILSVTALTMLSHGSSWAQSAGGNDTAAQVTALAAQAMEPQSFEALLDDTDAIVQGVMSQTAPFVAYADTIRQRVYDVHYPVIVFQREDTALGLDPGPSWTQTISVRLVERARPDADRSAAPVDPPGTITPGIDCLLFLKQHADALWVTAAFRIVDKRVVPLLPEATFIQESAGRKVTDFTVDVLTQLFLRRAQGTAASE